jgi:hypothetical protein
MSDFGDWDLVPLTTTYDADVMRGSKYGFGIRDGDKRVATVAFARKAERIIIEQVRITIWG